MTLESFYRRYVDMANARQFERLPEFAHEHLLQNGEPATRAAMLADLRMHVEAVPDLTWHIEDLVVSDNRIAARLRDTGTPVKQWHGFEPTGRSVSFTECVFYTLRDGRFSATWYLMDSAAVQQQLSG